jgi:hypothetical protein
MQEMGIQAVAKRKYQATTDSAHTKPVAENHLNRDVTPEKPNTSLPQDHWLATSVTLLNDY